MFVYVAKKQWAWVGAIFQYNADAVAWWAKVPPELQGVLEGLEQPGLEYPFMVIEWFPEDPETRSNGFEFLSLEEGEEALRATPQTLPDSTAETDWTYCNVYVISEDYHGHPDEPGKDYMGRLDHWHVDNEWLQANVNDWPWRK